MIRYASIIDEVGAKIKPSFHSGSPCRGAQKIFPDFENFLLHFSEPWYIIIRLPEGENTYRGVEQFGSSSGS